MSDFTAGGPSIGGGGSGGGGGAGTSPLTLFAQSDLITGSKTYTFTPTAKGVYRVSAYLNLISVSVGNSLQIVQGLAWTDNGFTITDELDVTIGPGLAAGDGNFDNYGAIAADAGEAITLTITATGGGTFQGSALFTVEKVA